MNTSKSATQNPKLHTSYKEATKRDKTEKAHIKYIIDPESNYNIIVI